MGGKIKLLWFCNTAANGGDVIANGISGSGTWLRTLDIAIQSKVDLHVAFYHSESIEYSVDRTRYYGIRRYKSVANKLLCKISERFFDCVRDASNIDSYLDLISKVNPDLIHIHGTENSFGCIINSVKIPVVVSIQGLLCEVDSFYTKGLGERLMSVRDFNFRSVKNAIFPSNFANAKFKFEKMAAIEAKNIRSAKYIIGRTCWDKRITGLLAPQRTYFHNDEIMRSEFINATWLPQNRPGNQIRLHTTSDNVYYKGLETVCETILHLKCRGYSCKWNIAGVSDHDLIVKVLKKKFGSKFPKDEINFLGKKSCKGLIESMLNSDFFVMPSNIENSPNSLCEAMLLGIPCIATSAGGTADFLDEDNGILVQPGDSYSIAAAVVDLNRNISKSFKLSKNARTAALARHDPNLIVNNLVEIYKSILMTSLNRQKFEVDLQGESHAQR